MVALSHGPHTFPIHFLSCAFPHSYGNSGSAAMPTTLQKRIVRLSDFQCKSIDWLWPGRLPAGKLALLDGDPDQGKSLITLDWTARLTTARPFPDGYSPPQPASVV